MHSSSLPLDELFSSVGATKKPDDGGGILVFLTSLNFGLQIVTRLTVAQDPFYSAAAPTAGLHNTVHPVEEQQETVPH